MTCPAPRHNRTAYWAGLCRCAIGREDRRLYSKRRREGRAPVLRIPVLGYRRKIQSLMAAGWSLANIGEVIGMERHDVWRIATRKKWIFLATATRLDHAWATLSEYDGTSARSIAHAEKMGWAPPWAWEGRNMDDPRATPCLELPPTVDEVLVERLIQGRCAYRDLNPAERVLAFRAATAAGWSGLRIQQEFRISGSILNGLKKAA